MSSFNILRTGQAKCMGPRLQNWGLKLPQLKRVLLLLLVYLGSIGLCFSFVHGERLDSVCPAMPFFFYALLFSQRPSVLLMLARHKVMFAYSHEYLRVSFVGSTADLLYAQVRHGDSTFRIKCRHNILFWLGHELRINFSFLPRPNGSSSEHCCWKLPKQYV